MHEDIRTIIKVGKTSFGVILPKAWVRYHKLSNGDKVKVISGNTVEIIPLREYKDA